MSAIPASDRNALIDAMGYVRQYLDEQAKHGDLGNAINAQHTLDRLQNMLDRTKIAAPVTNTGATPDNRSAPKSADPDVGGSGLVDCPLCKGSGFSGARLWLWRCLWRMRWPETSARQPLQSPCRCARPDVLPHLWPNSLIRMSCAK